MSTSKWAYEPEKCDGQPCPGDCDSCPRAGIEETAARETLSATLWELVRRLEEDGTFRVDSIELTGPRDNPVLKINGRAVEEHEEGKNNEQPG